MYLSIIFLDMNNSLKRSLTLLSVSMYEGLKLKEVKIKIVDNRQETIWEKWSIKIIK